MIKWLISFSFAAILGLLYSPLVSAQGTYTPQRKQELTVEITEEIGESIKNAKINQGWDTTFKIGLLVIALGAAAGAAYLATLGEVAPPRWLKVSNAVLAVATAALTSFAFSQFDFARRHAIWRERAIQLTACKDVLQDQNPSPEAFNKLLTSVRSLGDLTPVSGLGVSCAASERRSPPASPAPAASPASK